MTTVFVKGIEFYAYHGVTDEEQVIGHRYKATVELTVNSGAEQSDNVQDTVDYGAIAKMVIEIATSSQYRTVERLAQVIAENLLATFPKVQEVMLSISKRCPPMPVVAEEAGVLITLNRVV